MALYDIFTDAAADLPRADLERYGIRTIPMEYMLGDREIVYDCRSDEREALCRELYAAQREGGAVHTSQISPYHFGKAWKPVLREGRDVLYLCFSSGLSTTYQNALSAADELREEFPDRVVRVVDTLAATAGQGVCVCTAGINRDEKGMTLQENADWLEANAPRLFHYFTVGDLDYLHRGGRLSTAAALIGGLMEIKPMMILGEDGKLHVTGKSTGKRMAIKHLVRAYEKQQPEPGDPALLFITHSANDEDAALLREQLEKAAPEGTRIEVMLQCPIIGAHTGPWFLSVCGWGSTRG